MVAASKMRRAQEAAIASLFDCKQVERSLRVNSAGKKQLYKAFKEMRVKYAPTQANFIFVPHPVQFIVYYLQ